MTKRWVRARSAASKAAIIKAAKRAARPYRTGKKVAEWNAPRQIREHGRYKTPQQAAKDAYRRGIVELIADRYPTVETYRHHRRQTGKTIGRRTSTRGTWTLRKAHVARGKGGRFTKRRAK